MSSLQGSDKVFWGPFLDAGVRSLIPPRVQQTFALRIMGWIKEQASLLVNLSELYTVNPSALSLGTMIQFGEKVQHAPCFLAGKQANVPSWELRLSREESLWHSPPQINHRLNMSALSVILFLHSTLYGGTNSFCLLFFDKESPLGLLPGRCCTSNEQFMH